MSGARHHATCAAERCGAAISRGWFCKDHYFTLPDDLRRDVLDAYNAARKGHCRAAREEQDRLNREYGRAFRACVDFLRDAPVALTGATAFERGRAVTFVEGRRL